MKYFIMGVASRMAKLDESYLERVRVVKNKGFESRAYTV